MNGYIIYGRLKSTRLPRKALLRLAGDSLVRIIIDQVAGCAGIDRIVFATSDLPEDTPLAELAAQEGLAVYRGYPEDVLTRLGETARLFGFDRILTTVIDCPFQLGAVIDETLVKLVQEKYDMVRSYPGQPNGTDCFGLSREALERAIAVKQARNTECWAGYFTDTGMFRCAQVNLFAAYPELQGYRLTIDYPEDRVFCETVYRELTERGERPFSLESLITVLQKPAHLALLEKMRQCSLCWDGHFNRCASDVERDVARIVAARRAKETG